MPPVIGNKSPASPRHQGLRTSHTRDHPLEGPNSSYGPKYQIADSNASHSEEKSYAGSSHNNKWKTGSKASHVSKLSKLSHEGGKLQRFKKRFLKNLGIKFEVASYLAVNLKFFPLRFSDNSIERRFFEINHELFPMRMLMFGIGALIVNVAIWIYLSTHIIIKDHYLEHAATSFPVFETSQIFGFHIMEGVTCVCCMTLALAQWIPFIKKNLEVSSYFILSFVTIGVIAFSIFGILRTPQRTLNPASITFDDIITLLVATDFKFWSDALINLSGYGLTLAVDVFFPTRTRISILFHILIFVVIGGAYLGTAIHLGNSYQILQVLQLQIIVLAVVIFLGYLGRYMIELSDRASAYELIKNLDRLAQLEAEIQADKSKTKSSTAVEELISIIKQSQNELNNVKLGRSDEWERSEELLKKALNVLTRTDNLYAVRFAGGTGEDDEFSRQFIEIYANEKKKEEDGVPKKSGSRVKAKGTLNTDGTQSLLSPRETYGRGGGRKRTVRDPSTYSVHTAAILQIPKELPARLLNDELLHPAGTDWGLDLLKIGRQTQHPLMEVGISLLEPYINALWTTNEMLYRFLFELGQLYAPNPYHNELHGATVAHMTATMARYLGVIYSSVIEECEIAIILIAALAHDAGHPGRNNAFFINTYHPLSVLYNDRAPLENLHCCLLFKLLAKESTNIMKNLDDETYRSCRKNMINIILATDMKNHFESISFFRVRRSAADFDFLTNKDDLWQTITMLVKAADLGHACVDWMQHSEWSCRVVEEFYQQGEEEAELGYSVSPLCDRSNHREYAKSQKGFIEFVVQPLYKEIEEIDQSGQISIECVRCLVYNRYKWEERAKDISEIPIPDEIKAMKTSHKGLFVLDELENVVLDGPDASVEIARVSGKTLSPPLRRESTGVPSSHGNTFESQDTESEETKEPSPSAVTIDPEEEFDDSRSETFHLDDVQSKEIGFDRDHDDPNLDSSSYDDYDEEVRRLESEIRAIEALENEE